MGMGYDLTSDGYFYYLYPLSEKLRGTVQVHGFASAAESCAGKLSHTFPDSWLLFFYMDWMICFWCGRNVQGMSEHLLQHDGHWLLGHDPAACISLLAQTLSRNVKNTRGIAAAPMRLDQIHNFLTACTWVMGGFHHCEARIPLLVSYACGI